MDTPSDSISRRVVIMRHAKSSWNQPELSDFERPLNDRGKHDAPRMGQQLREQKIAVDLVLASTAVRVRETLELLLPAWNYSGPVIWEKQIYLASPETLSSLLASLDTAWTSVMLVGHNPGLSYLAGGLTQTEVDMPTAGVIVLQCNASDWAGAVRKRDWEQVAFWRPKHL